MGWTAETWIAMGACVVSACGIGVALLLGIPALVQAISAKRQADVAMDSANIARSAAQAAERQATATEAQLELTRAEYADRSAELDEAAGPVFLLERAYGTYSGERFITATVVMVSGPALRSVVVIAKGSEVRHLSPRASGYDELDRLHLADLAPGGRITAIVQMEHESMTPLHVTIEMVCTEDGEKNRVWTRSCTATVDEFPTESSEWGLFRR